MTIYSLWGAAAALLLLGLAMTYRSAAVMKKDTARFKQKVANLEEMKMMQREVGAQISARRSFDKLETLEPGSMPDLVKKVLPGIKAAITIQKQKDTIPGWAAHRIKVDLAEKPTPVTDILDLAVQSERLRPPWQLEKCQLWASPQKEGMATASLTFIALEKK